MIFLQAMLWLVIAPATLIVVGLLWRWLEDKLLAYMLGR